MRGPHLAKLAALFLPVAVCASNVKAQRIYYTGIAGIARVNLDGTNPEDLWAVSEGNLLGGKIAVDVVRGHLYWTNPGSVGVRRSDLDGANVQDVIPDLLGSALALDVEQGKLYFTDGGVVMRSNLDGSDPEVVVESNGVTAIALDLRNKKVYWPETFPQVGLFRANFDGTNVELLVDDIDLIPVALALDISGGKLYWSANDVVFAKRGSIFRSNLDGSAEETLFPRVISWGLAVDEQSRRLYFTRIDGGIYRANLDGSGLEEVFDTGFIAPFAIALDLRGAPIPSVSAWGLAVLGLLTVTIRRVATRKAATKARYGRG